MPGYIIATLNSINDPDAFTAYQKSASTSFTQYGAKFLLNSRNVETLDGDCADFGARRLGNVPHQIGFESAIAKGKLQTPPPTIPTKQN